MRFVLLYILTALNLSILAQEDCFSFSEIEPIDGESLFYEMDYHWGFIWISAGEVLFKNNIEEEQYSFTAYAKSKDNWTWFYPVMSKYESRCDLNFNPTFALRVGREGSNYHYDEYRVEEDSIYYNSRKENGKIKSQSVYEKGYCPRDVISGIYSFRYLDYDQYREGETIDFDLLLDGKVENSYVRYEGVTEWKNPKTKEKIKCYVLKPMLIEGTVFKSGENMTVYLSADKYRLPLYIETKLIVGKAKIILQDAKGTQSPLFTQ